MRSLPLVILALLLATPAFSQPIPNFTSASVDVVVPGKSAEITLTGDNIWNATAIHLTGEPGVSATIHPPTTQPTKDKPLRELRLKLTATKDAPRGPRELRVVTPNGITRPLQITVDDYDPLTDKEPNNDFDKPQDVTLPAILVGTINGGADIDTFRFQAKKGQRMIFDVFANRIGSKLDSTLRLFDDKGREIARDEDTAGLDSLLDIEIPKDGAYTLMIHDLRYQGGPDFNYRIRAGEIPYVRSIFPLGGQRGQSVSIELAGRNLARPRMDMTLSSAMPLGRMDITAHTPRGISNAHTFEVGNLPESFEQEPNDDAKHANPTTMPVVINGRIAKAGDSDTYRIRPTTRNAVAEIFSQRYGSNLDALLTLRDASGNILARNDDTGPGSADARIALPDPTAPGTDYFLTVSDLHGYGGDDFAYRLQIAAAARDEPDFDLLFSPDMPRVPRTGHMKLWCFARRKGGIESDITITLDNLPKGLSCEPLVIGKTAGSGLLVISATKDAPLGFHPLTLTATAKIADKTISRSLTPRGVSRNSPPVYLTVLPEPPFRISQLGDPTFNDPKAIKAEIAYLEEKLSNVTPELASKVATWEADQMTKLQWHPIEVEAVRNAPLTTQPDGSLLAGGAAPAKVTYNIVGHTKLKRIAAIKLEALADDGKGPGRAADGNFVLTKFIAQAIVDGKDAETLDFNKPTADFSQADYNIESTIGPVQDQTGWAIFPQTSQSHWAIWPLKKPIENQGGNLRLSFDLVHGWRNPTYVLRRFRLLVTGEDNAPGGFSLPNNVLSVLLIPRDKRTEPQSAALLAHYRATAPEFAEDRSRLALLKGAQSPFPPRVVGNREASILVTVDRRGFEGDITLTLEGWANNFDPKTLQPLPIATNLDLKPIVLKGKDTRAAVKFTTSPRTERATRTIVIRADAQVDGTLYTQYSPLVPLTVSDPPPPPKEEKPKEEKK